MGNKVRILILLFSTSCSWSFVGSDVHYSTTSVSEQDNATQYYGGSVAMQPSSFLPMRFSTNISRDSSENISLLSAEFPIGMFASAGRSTSNGGNLWLQEITPFLGLWYGDEFEEKFGIVTGLRLGVSRQFGESDYRRVGLLYTIEHLVNTNSGDDSKLHGLTLFYEVDWWR